MKKSVTKSSASGEEDKQGKGKSPKPRSSGKTPKQIMDKHLHDENHVISEEDFKNLDISVEVSNDSSHKPLRISGDKGRPKDEDKDPGIVTPWDVIK